MKKILPVTVIALAIFPFFAFSQTLGELRDEALCNIGWVAGNAYGHPIWPQIRPFVGRDGDYYKTFVRLKESGESDSSAALNNVNTYEDCRKRGEMEAFSEKKSVNRIQRVLDIAESIKSR